MWGLPKNSVRNQWPRYTPVMCIPIGPPVRRPLDCHRGAVAPRTMPRPRRTGDRSSCRIQRTCSRHAAAPSSFYRPRDRTRTALPQSRPRRTAGSPPGSSDSAFGHFAQSGHTIIDENARDITSETDTPTASGTIANAFENIISTRLSLTFPSCRGIPV